MCYLIAKNVDKVGCVAIEMTIGRHLAEFKQKLLKEFKSDKLQLVTISRPSAYGEYEPYRFADTEDEFRECVGQIA